MSSCERCWKEANGNADRYHELLAINRCSPEEQAGENATECPHCHRLTVHQRVHYCVNLDCSAGR